MRHVANDGVSIANLADEILRNRARWLLGVLNDFQMARGVRVPDGFVEYLREHLDRVGYSSALGERARVWILYGDWTFRGKSPELLLSDFFPTDEQVRAATASLVGGELVVLSRTYLADAVRAARVEGQETARREFLDNVANRDSTVLDAQKLAAAAIVRAVDAESELERVRAENDRLRRRVEKLRNLLENKDDADRADRAEETT